MDGISIDVIQLHVKCSGGAGLDLEVIVHCTRSPASNCHYSLLFLRLSASVSPPSVYDGAAYLTAAELINDAQGLMSP